MTASSTSSAAGSGPAVCLRLGALAMALLGCSARAGDASIPDTAQRTAPAPASGPAAPTATPQPSPGASSAAVSGTLVDQVRALDRVRARCRRLEVPSTAKLNRSRLALSRLLRGRVAEARLLYGELGFEVLELHRPGQLLYVVREEPRETPRGWGFYVVNPRPLRMLVLEAPHSQHDLHTGVQAAELMVRLQARALLVSTTHRCASTRPTRCGGHTGACRQIRRHGRFRSSDRAHITRSLFHAAHVTLMEDDPRLVAVQLHGFSRRPWRRRHVILSDGTRRYGRRSSLSNGLARVMRAMLPARRRHLVRSCNERGQRYLCGTSNVQGRHTNGSPDPCRTPARRSSNRFIQVEQSLDARTPGGRFDHHLLRRAMERLWPERKHVLRTGRGLPGGW